MAEQELDRVENEEEWDLDTGGVGQPVLKRRSVVSVSLNRDDFMTISICAEQHNMKTSEFMRRASLQKANERNVSLSSIQGTFTVSFFGGMTNSALTSGTAGSEDLKAEKTDHEYFVVEREQSWVI